MTRLSLLFCLFLLPSPLPGQTNSAIPAVPPGTNLKDASALLPLAIAANSLDRPGIPPYYLKATYESYDENGKQADSGTFEEWRMAPDKSKRVYTGTHFSQTEYETSAGIYYETDAGAEPWPVSLVAKQLVHPAPEEWETKDARPELRTISAKSLKLSCLTLSPPAKTMEWPVGLLPTYCFNVDSILLRVEIFNTMMQARRNDIVAFHGVYLAKDISVSDNTKPLLQVHLMTVTALSPEEVAAANALPGFVTVVPAHGSAKPVDLSPGVMTAHKTGGPNPIYPERSRLEHVQGTVLLSAIIGTDGRVHHLSLISSPDEWLAMSAVAAVGRWVYKPYTLNGDPISVRTKVTVVYTMGPPPRHPPATSGSSLPPAPPAP